MENKYPEVLVEQVYIWLRNKAITSGFCLLLESSVMGMGNVFCNNFKGNSY